MPFSGHNSKPLLMTADSIETRNYHLAGLRFRLSQVGGKLRVQAIAAAEAPAHADVERGPLWGTGSRPCPSPRARALGPLRRPFAPYRAVDGVPDRRRTPKLVSFIDFIVARFGAR